MSRTGVAGLLSRSVVEIAVFTVVINVLLLVMPLYLLQVYDRVLAAASIDTLLYLSIIALGALVFLGLFEVVRAIYSQRVAANLDRILGSKAFAASVMGARAEGGDTQSLRDLSSVRNFIASRGVTTLIELPFAPLFIVFLYFVHPILCWMTLAGAVVILLLVVLNQWAIAKTSAEAGKRSTAAMIAAQAFTRNAETVRTMGMLRNATEVWGAQFAGALQAEDRSARINAVFSGISRSTRMLLQLAILGAGAYLVLKGEMTAGMIFASSIISGRALQPLDQLIAGWRQTVDARKAWGRLKSALQDPALQVPRRLQLPPPTGRITVRDLVFAASSAPGAEPIIKRLSFDIAAGESVAVIGPSRAGKSTLARLLVGAVKPSSGVVQIDSSDLRAWDDVQLGKYVGYLSQEVQLLPGSIAQNIARFDKGATDEAIVQAAQRARAHELIRLQTDGYQTAIAAAGASLSGGERQRIGLARAFYGDPRILVLDEPNANLDSEGEQALEQALAGAKAAGTTVVVVTHRMAVAAASDKILILRNGVIEAFGPSQEILRRMSDSARGVQTPAPAPVHAVPKTDITNFGTFAQAGGAWKGPKKTGAN